MSGRELLTSFGGLGERRSARLERLKANAPRIVACALMGILALAGLKEILIGDPAQPRTKAAEGVDHPSERLALGFARAYLSFDARRPQLRERALAAYVPEGLDSDAGFLPSRGRQHVVWAEVAQNQRALAGGRAVVVAAQLSGQPDPAYLAVPVDRDAEGRVFVAGYPAFVGAPSTNLAPPTPLRETVTERALFQLAERVLTNYLVGSSENLKADLDSSAVVTLPTVSLEVTSLDELVWADKRQSAVLATVTALDQSRNPLTLTYELGIAYGERPYVTFVQVAPNEP